MHGIDCYSSRNNTISGNIITSNNNAGIYLESASNENRILGNSISLNSVGIALKYSSNKNSISNNNISHNNYSGILAEELCEGNSIRGNTINSNGQHGIHLSSSPTNTIDNNMLCSNGITGISLVYAHANDIVENTLSFNHDTGICFQNSCDNTIWGNFLISNDLWGVYVWSSSRNNLFYANNFINNGQNAYDICTNHWDRGYLHGGNYWADFDEPEEGAYDDFKGEYQTILGGDGIVDLGLPDGGLNPYVIYRSLIVTNQDNYPWTTECILPS
jgi:parallel beta-helix repeat protein